ncbi:MAG: hypothetical protein QM758_29060 [Armatimonas sp.]
MLNRRMFLSSALLFGAAGALTLVGCGGGGSNQNSAGLTLSAVPCRLTLPSALNVGEVLNLFGTSKPRSDGTFDLAVAAESPLLTIALGPGGGPLAMGFLTKEARELSPHSSAVVLAHFVLGVGVLPAEIQSLYLDAIPQAEQLFRHWKTPSPPL